MSVFLKKGFTIFLVSILVVQAFVFFQFGIFPVYAQTVATFDVVSDAYDQHSQNFGDVYSTVQSATDGLTVSNVLNCGQGLLSTTYTVYRTFCRFDTSTLSGSTLVSARLLLGGNTDLSGTDFIIKIQGWTDAADGIGVDDYSAFDGVSYDDNLFSTSSFSLTEYNNITISNMDLINISSYTDICVRSSLDISATPPTATERVVFDDTGDSQPSKLEVTYVTTVPEYDYVDGQSDVDSSVDVGTHSSFTAQKATDWTNDTLTEANTNVTVLNDSENFVDSNTSNIDSHTGHGTSSNFTAQQDANVLYNDTLTEANTAAAASNTTVLNNGFEVGAWNSLFDQTTGTWICCLSGTPTGYTPHAGTNATYCGSTNDGSIYSDDVDMTTATKIYVTFWWMDDDLDGGTDFEFYVYDGSAYDLIVQLDATGQTYAEDTWYQYSWSSTDNQYFDTTFRLCFSATPEPNEAAFIDDVVIIREVTPANNYELDYEFSWTTASFSEANEYLCIRTNSYSGTAENLGVDVWTGSWTTLSASLTASTWNNISITTYLTSGTIYFRFIGKTESSDTAQNTWVIECNLVHTWSVGINYELDIEEQFTSANFSRTSEELCIRIGTMNGETLSVQWWNATSSTWLTIIASLSANQWNNVSVTTYLTAATFTIKFIDGTKTSDTSQSTWNKDACLLHTWDIANAAPTVADLRLSLISDTVNITTGITVNTWYDWEANVTDAETLNDISTVTIRIANNPSLAISADSAGYNESSVYWFRYTNTTDIWEWYSGAAWTATSNWIDGNCTNPTKTETNGFYLFRIRLSKVARYSSSWEFAALATDSVSNTATKTFTGISIAKYDELVMITTTHTWTNINIGGVNVLVDEGAILFNVSCNYNFKLQAQSNSSWVESGDGYKIGIGNITIHKDTLGSAVPLTVAYADIGGLTNLNTLTANTQYSFKLWATIPEDTAYDKTYAYKCQVQTEDA